MKILYAGDSWEGGPANYLLAILRHMNADFLHLPAAIRMNKGLLEEPYNLIILSDYARNLMENDAEKKIISQFHEGCGILMIGGWGSFAGPFGGWKDSLIESILPVDCLAKDDRVNFSGGALITQKEQHSLLRDLSFSESPVLCGLNEVTPKKDCTVLLTAQRILQKKSGDSRLLALENKEHPLLAVDNRPNIRSAVLTTDVAPHWCGGFVDWGTKSLKLAVNPKITVEVGNSYIQFLSQLLSWLCRAS